MKLTDIEHIIAQGENSAVEFKSGDTKPDAIAKEMIAFANMSGGVILIGVEDDGSISGIEDDKNWEEWTMNIAQKNVNPPLIVEFETVQIQQKNIACISVSKGNNKPYQTIDGRFYIRVGSTNRTASQLELMRLFQQAGLLHFDTTAVERTSKKSLNPIKLNEYWTTYYQIDYLSLSENEQLKILQNADILTDNNSEVQTTVGGLLIFGYEPQRFLPQSNIVFAVYAGTELIGELNHKANITGTLPEQIDNTLSLLNTFIPKSSVINGLKREENIRIPAKVLREAIVNAVTHRDYSRNKRISVYKFDNRIEIISPGKLHNSLTIAKILTGNSEPRNLFLLKYLENMRYIDGLGRGVPMMLAEMKNRIEFAEIGEEFKVTLEL